MALIRSRFSSPLLSSPILSSPLSLLSSPLSLLAAPLLSSVSPLSTQHTHMPLAHFSSLTTPKLPPLAPPPRRFLHSRLCRDQSIHHAVHLAANRKLCESQGGNGGLELLKRYLRQPAVGGDAALIESVLGRSRQQAGGGGEDGEGAVLQSFTNLDEI